VIELLLILAMLQQGEPGTPAEEPVRKQPSGVLTVKGADLQLLSAVRTIAERIEELRGERFGRAPIAVRTPDHMREVAAEIRALNVLHRNRLEARGRAWADLGLGGPSSPGTVYITLAADLSGIGFDPEGNRLLVAPDRLTDQDFAPEEPEDAGATVLLMTGVRVDEPLASHLLMHVRQRERSGHDTLAESTDALLARSAWAEGEANLVAIRYLFGGMGLADDVLEEEIEPADVLDGALFPDGLEELSGAEGALVRFVYEEGFASAVRTFRTGGWKGLDAAMARGKTTRDLLHPKTEPLPPAEFPAPTLSQTEGLQLIDEDTLGEEAIFVLVSTLTGKDNLALQAGDGWAGDRLYRWEPTGGDPDRGVTQWKTRWTEEQGAKDFAYAIRRTLEARFPDRPPITLDDGQEIIQTATQLFRLQRHGLEVHLQISAKDLDPLPAGALTDAP
jgi:hypothetical protein